MVRVWLITVTLISRFAKAPFMARNRWQRGDSTTRVCWLQMSQREREKFFEVTSLNGKTPKESKLFKSLNIVSLRHPEMTSWPSYHSLTLTRNRCVEEHSELRLFYSAEAWHHLLLQAWVTSVHTARTRMSARARYEIQLESFLWHLRPGALSPLTNIYDKLTPLLSKCDNATSISDNANSKWHNSEAYNRASLKLNRKQQTFRRFVCFEP